MLGRGRSGRWVPVVAVAVLVALAVRDDGDPGAAAHRNAVAAVYEVLAPNGDIVHSEYEDYWTEESPPRVTGAPPYPAWVAFDQRTGSFLYNTGSGGVLVVGAEGLRSKFDCDHPWPSCQMITFGPGPDEVTVPVDDPGGLNFLQSARVMGLDGTVRDTLDLPAAVVSRATGQPQPLAGLAWSPDGSRLAVSIEPESDCNPRRFPCEGQVWLVDRDGGRPRLVFSERGSGDLLEGRYPNLPVLRKLAWSPRGHSLALIVSRTMLGHPEDDARSRLIALRFLLGRRVRTDTLHVHDDRPHQIGPGEEPLDLAFAWSPDGSRIALRMRDGIAEISAEDGRVLARHPGKQPLHGPLAWLRKR